MNTRKQIDELFAAYEKTEALEDFKEEIESNMNAKIEAFIARGKSEEEAFVQATNELGDIAEIAEAASLKRKREVIEENYMGIRKYITKKKALAYAGATLLVVFGAITGAIVYNSVNSVGDPYDNALVATIASVWVFVGAAIFLFVFLGLTQESSAHYPMKKARALCYSAGVLLAVSGFALSVMDYFAIVLEDNYDKAGAVAGPAGVLIAFVLPAIGLFVYLGLTEKSRKKPWIIKQEEKWLTDKLNRFGDRDNYARFELISGALWIAAVSGFIVLTMNFGIKYSWLVLPLSVVTQMLLAAGFLKSKQR